jgi:hypothetical protein
MKNEKGRMKREECFSDLGDKEEVVMTFELMK